MMKDLDKLVAQLAEDAATVKPAPHPYWLGLKLMAAAAAYLAVLLAFSGLRPELARSFSHPWFIAEIAALLLILISTAISAALLAFPDLHQKRLQAVTPIWLFGILWLVVLFAWHADSPPAPLPVHSFECSLSIALVALLPAAWSFYALRNYASTHHGWAGAIAVLSAFSIGAIWLRLHEANDSIAHVVEWHYLPMIAAGALGVWLGKILLRW
jgi:hypothetical protein